MLERLLQFIEDNGFTIASFERTIGVSNATISKAIERKKGISSDVLVRILERFQSLNPDWLLLGKEPKLRQDSLKNPEVLDELLKAHEKIGMLEYQLQQEKEKVSSFSERMREVSMSQ